VTSREFIYSPMSVWLAYAVSATSVDHWVVPIDPDTFCRKSRLEGVAMGPKKTSLKPRSMGVGTMNQGKRDPRTVTIVGEQTHSMDQR
jgi:hypothetical protein